MYLCTCMCAYAYIYIGIYEYIYIYSHIFIYICMVDKHIYMTHGCVWFCKSVYLHICICT